MLAFRNSIGFTFMLAAFAGATLAQSSSPLPGKLSGRWTAVIPGGRTFTDSVSVVLESPDNAGAVKGRLTVRGVTCGAIDEPLTGTWDGSELKFESLVRPNVNATRQNGECGNGRVSFALKRKPGENHFVGESLRDGAASPTQVTMSP
jgi:hypothetical protein